MALTKQKVPMAFTNGINTKTDSKQLSLGILTTAENINFDSPGKIQKSNGYEALSLLDVNGGKLSNLKSVTSFNDELLALTNKDLYAYSENIERWIHKGKVVDVRGSSLPVVKNEKQQSQLDCIYVNNTKVFVYVDSEGIKYTVIDRLNDTVLVYNQLVSSTGARPRLGKIGNSVFIIYYISTSIYYKEFSIVNPSSLSAQTVLVNADLNAAYNFDVASTTNGRISLVYNAVGTAIKIVQILSDFTITSAISVGSESASTTIDVNLDDKERLMVSYYNGTEVKLFVITSNLSAFTVSPVVIETVANILHTTAQFNGTTFDVYYSQNSTYTYNHLVRHNTCTTGSVVGTPSVFLRSVDLCGKAIYNSSTVYVPIMHNSTLQSTYFLADSSGSIIHTISPGLGGDLISVILPRLDCICHNVYLFASQVKGRVITDTGSFYSLLGVNSTEIEFNTAESTMAKVLGENLHIASGIISTYDGAQVVEHSYFLYPENLSATSVSTGGYMSDGTYYFTAVYNWTDSKGQQHISNPAIPIQVVLSGGTTTQKVSIVVPTLRITEKSNVVIDVYRTEDSGTIYYKDTLTISPVLNNKAVDTVTIVSDQPDSTLVGKETLYTTGGVLENIIPPQATIIESFGNRLFLAGLENENKILYSKIRGEGSPVEFNDTQYTLVSPLGGQITSLIAMDDKLIIFKNSAVYYLSGNGPNNLGEDNTFIQPELISSDVGCVNRDSVVLTASGIYFKSAKGIYLLGRDLSSTYVGAPVEKFNDLTITSADVVSNRNVIRFATNSGLCLVHNYFTNTWSTYTNFLALDAEIVKGVYYYLRSDSNIYKENNSFSNNGTDIKIKIETGWLNLTGTVMDFQRIYRMLLLGDFKSTHKLRIKVAYDYAEAYTQEVIVDPSTFTNATPYGNYSPYGSESVYSGNGNVYQIEIKFARQKCKSMKLLIEDITEDGGEGLSLSNLQFILGVKSNPATTNAGRTFATTRS